MSITRRKFLKGTAAGLGCLGMSSVAGFRYVSKAHAEELAKQQVKYVASSCAICTNKCVFRGQVVNGDPDGFIQSAGAGKHAFVPFLTLGDNPRKAQPVNDPERQISLPTRRDHFKKPLTDKPAIKVKPRLGCG